MGLLQLLQGTLALSSLAGMLYDGAQALDLVVACTDQAVLWASIRVHPAHLCHPMRHDPQNGTVSFWTRGYRCRKVEGRMLQLKEKWALSNGGEVRACDIPGSAGDTQTCKKISVQVPNSNGVGTVKGDDGWNLTTPTKHWYNSPERGKRLRCLSCLEHNDSTSSSGCCVGGCGEAALGR